MVSLQTKTAKGRLTGERHTILFYFLMESHKKTCNREAARIEDLYTILTKGRGLRLQGK